MSGEPTELLKERQAEAERRLGLLSDGLSRLSSLKDLRNLCIYATGSFGRLEASEFSDLDLFFVTTEPVSRIDKTLLDADIIRLARDHAFPEFSRDGTFLEIHELKSILQNLGGQEDDFRNHFTARLLLLLESRSVFGSSIYNHVLNELVQAYYRDYQNHEVDFQPVFLANDIVRFWKTLCLNYEHRRNRRSKDDTLRAKNHLKNLKLKFSRMLTCYSALAWIAGQETGPGPDRVFEMVKMSPLLRLRGLLELNDAASNHVNAALKQYAWFLQVTGQSEQDVLKWISDSKNRDHAFDRGREFGKEIFELILRVSEGKPFLRYLIV